jgi:hypothetical protein
MSLRQTAISKPSRDFNSTNDERLRVISTSVSVHGRATHDSSPRSTEASEKIAVPSDKGEQGPHCRICRQVASSDGYDELLMRDVARGDASAMRMIFLRHQQRVFRFILRLVHCVVLCQDVVRYVFL